MKRLIVGSEKGMTLIEILVSLLILAVGLLGMSGLQTVSLRNSQSAYFRTQANILSSDVAERIRANTRGIVNGNYDNNDGEVNVACNTLAGCSASSMAGNDMAEWKAALASNLPSGVGTVCLDSNAEDGTIAITACDGSGTMMAIKIWWDEDRDGVAEKRYVSVYQP
jgi:type IV pilus assembly protein PilV